MPITTKHGSIFDSTAQVLVCPVNCVGVMGKGLALEFKRRFPDMFEWYQFRCRMSHEDRVKPGDIMYYYVRYGPCISLAATKEHWKDPSKIEWIETLLVGYGAMTDQQSIACPSSAAAAAGSTGPKWSRCTRSTWAGWTATWRFGFMSELKWIKDDGEYITASANGCDFIICKTASYPPAKIPAAQRWTLEVYGPWYMCKCFPRLFDCYAAADRVRASMPTLEPAHE